MVDIVVQSSVPEACAVLRTTPNTALTRFDIGAIAYPGKFRRILKIYRNYSVLTQLVIHIIISIYSYLLVIIIQV